MIKRVYTKKIKDYDVESNNLKEEINKNLLLNLKSIKVYNCYDLFDVSETELTTIVKNILSEPNTDQVLYNVNLESKKFFAVKVLDSQYNPREESAMDCSNLLLSRKVLLKHFKLYVFENNLDYDTLVQIKNYIINPIECYEYDLFSKHKEFNLTKSETTFYNFNELQNTNLETIYNKNNLAMSIEDFNFIVEWSIKNNKVINDVELHLLDTYWSDHCRHKTFETLINNINLQNIKGNIYLESIKGILDYYYKNNIKKQLTLMNIATCYIKKLISENKIEDLELSEEINASSIYVDLEKTKCIVQFKNETHNHPTEIEPYGGAATCLGGAIRDPLSGRAYVYQGLRVTGSGNILEDIKNTLANKLPQQKISKVSAEGFSSYGNQIGVPTTLVKEIYHEGYKAKRLEIGAVVGVTKIENIRRETPKNKDIIILVGGATGKDGIGGATGSSKNQNEESLKNSYSEVQKGNPVEERKLQRLFSKPNVSILIKKANDLGAGGIGVGAGELSDGVELWLDNVHLKYKGLSGKEILLSESQERMVAVISPKDMDTFINEALKENLIAVKIGEITNKNKFTVWYKDEISVDLNRDFINSGGIKNIIDAEVSNEYLIEKNILNENEIFSNEKFYNKVSELNIMSQKPMIEMFDFSIGSTTVLAPYGGLYQLSETQVSCQIIPIKENKNICTIMSYGYDPYLFERNVYLGSMLAIIESLAKVVAAGGSFNSSKLTLQEYFEKLEKNKCKWGKPILVLLGALLVQKELNIPAIGGKDSMSGTYKTLNVPPTLVSFALSTSKVQNIISTDFKKENNNIYYFKHNLLNGLPDFEQIKQIFNDVEILIKEKKVVSAFAIQQGGLYEALIKMSLGNDLGFNIQTDINIFEKSYGSIVIESPFDLENKNLIRLGKVHKSYIYNEKVFDKEIIKNNYLSPIKKIYYDSNDAYPEKNITTINNNQKEKKYYPLDLNLIKVLVVIFPGTNCEYDIRKAFKHTNVICEEFIFNNLNNKLINESIELLAKKIIESHIFVIPGGFSLGDEPDGSGKYIANVLKNETVKNAIKKFLNDKKLILGICNGFQALIKSGLLTNSEPQDLLQTDPSLIKNNVNRHVSKYVTCKTVSVNNPWTQDLKLNQLNNIPISHGEGRFVIDEEGYNELVKNDQIVFEYLDNHNNPNGSYYNIEGIVSKCGLILGKMGHSERKGDYICKNIYGDKNQDIFSSAINYFLKNKKGEL
ncbi:phosphoribosylformylglycinamidine synthase [Spiroplasma turonicum]|uniref:Uncharacterized protein n=1 Tax=Spiroplasma turonicum TaxID=216946 RepID=A0A0K1P7F1_9MOLU|nr:phosphoribosylformylglycinamidine synthase [Spiroplasma turonicum]AKU80236.1 hypothetical protein STURON_00990 [Spiroplasma turonicum]ALX71236.1 phosphoribosylformylglycinamidine synthase [Spiroplasma turonicum]